MQVQVYKNLHNGKWSIKANGLVIGHADKVILSDVTGSVSEAGRQRVLKDKSKNVHAFLVGTLEFTKGFTSFKGRSLPKTYNQGYPENTGAEGRVFYNPYRYTSFMHIETGKLTIAKFTGCEWIELYATVDVISY